MSSATCTCIAKCLLQYQKKTGVHLNICYRRGRQMTFSEFKIIGMIRIKIQEMVNSYIQNIEIMAIILMQ